MNVKLIKNISLLVFIFSFSLYSTDLSGQSRTSRPTQVKRTTSPRKTPPPPVKISASQIKKAEKQRLFTHYSGLAYGALNRGQLAVFLRYSDYALQTGQYSARLYYDRGYVFESLGDYVTARKEYRKADRMGYAPARYALSELEWKMRQWR